jgi:hypothetical protein
MKNVIRYFYEYAEERIIPGDADFRILIKQIEDDKKYLTSFVSKEDRERLEILFDRISKVHDMTTYAYFEYAFRHSSRLMCDILSGN